MKRFKNILLSLAIALGLNAGGLVLATQPVLAQNQAAICEGVEFTGGDCNTASADAEVNNIIKTVVDILSVVVGVVAVIMIIIGGLRYITSGGDSNNTSAAKNTILYAIIGLVVVAMAQVIVRFVLTQF